MAKGKGLETKKIIIPVRQVMGLGGGEIWIGPGGMELDPGSTPRRTVSYEVGGMQIAEENLRGILPVGAREILRIIEVIEG